MLCYVERTRYRDIDIELMSSQKTQNIPKLKMLGQKPMTVSMNYIH